MNQKLANFLVRYRIGAGHTCTFIAPIRDGLIYYIALDRSYNTLGIGSRFSISYGLYLFIGILLALSVYSYLCYAAFNWSFISEIDLIHQRFQQRDNGAESSVIMITPTVKIK